MLNRIVLTLLLLSVATSFTTALEARGGPPCRKRQTPCAPAERFWLDAEYLYWNLKDAPEPVPFVVEGPLSSSNAVLGGKSFKHEWQSGGKIGIGYWFDPSHRLAGEVSYLCIPNGSSSKSVSSDALPGSAVLSAPYINILNGVESYARIASPGLFSGTAKLKEKNSMQSSEANIIAVLPGDDGSFNISLLAGLRYWSFYETISLKTSSPFIAPLPADIYNTTDKFHVTNNFYGGQLGAKVEYKCNRLFATLLAKVAIGKNHQMSDISGSLVTNTFTNLGTVQTFQGGYFTLPSNIGKKKGEMFAVISEANISFGYQMTQNSYLKFGYHVMYMNNVLWAGNQIDNNLNPSQSVALSNNPDTVLIGDALPKNRREPSNFWAHGLNVGVSYHF